VTADGTRSPIYPFLFNCPQLWYARSTVFDWESLQLLLCVSCELERPVQVGIMEPLSLVLAIPSIVAAIRKCVRQYTELQSRFQGVNDDIQWIASKCTLLESALQQLRQIDTRNHEHIVDFVTKDCLRTIHALNSLLGRLGACIADTGTVSFSVRVEYAWKQEDIAAVLSRLDDCRSNITLCMTILQL